MPSPAARLFCAQVKTLTGKEIEIDIEPTDTVQRIKERVEEKEGIPPVQQRCVRGRRAWQRGCWFLEVTPNLRLTSIPRPRNPPCSLIFAGKAMNDEKMAKDYNIEGGSVLHLVLALRGGAGRQ